MPVAENKPAPDAARDMDRDADKPSSRDKGPKPKGPGGASASAASASAGGKGKDLSHVPCKFFRVGSCTAGPSCPFSHDAYEPGQAKGVCAWYIKGNCKFAHKCALAHVLPGQPMTMDRKNKKAAQLANAGSGASGGGGGRGGRGGKAGGGGGDSGPGPRAGGGRNPLLGGGGSTAPTRERVSSRPPMLKATVLPSAPAPPLQNTDFSNFGLPDENESTAPAQTKPAPASTAAAPGAIAATTPPPAADVTVAGVVPASPASPAAAARRSPTIPVSVPRRASITQRTSDFGPIGSPSRASPATRVVNGFSPGTSPTQDTHAQGALSPFSAPGTQTAFLDVGGQGQSVDAGAQQGGGGKDFRARSGIAASLGATRNWTTDYGPVPAQVAHGAGAGPSALSMSVGAGAGDLGLSAVEDDLLEDFVPGSLSDLLTPEERQRRMSKTALSTSPRHTHMPAHAQRALAGDAGQHHRYSRSVPATSLLGDLKSIWGADGGAGLPTSPGAGGAGIGIGIGAAAGVGSGAGGLGNGTPSSFKSTGGFGGRSALGADDSGMSLSPGALLSPTNASAAFLPGLHQHYLHAMRPGAHAAGGGGSSMGGGAGNGGGGGGGMRTVSGPALGGGMNGGMPGSLSAAALLGQSAMNNGGAFSPPTYGGAGGYGARTAHEGGAGDGYLRHHQGPGGAQAQRQAHMQLRDGGAHGLGRGHPHGHAHAHHGTHAHNHGLGGHDRAGDAALGLAMSPSALALQAHAPGQSLPQGLAAGYSRIHALPPPNIPSPSASAAAFSPGGAGAGALGGMAFSPGGSAQAQYGYADWVAGPGPGHGQGQGDVAASPGHAGAGAPTGLEAMFSRLSYSAATTSRPGANGGVASGGAVAATPPGAARSVSGGQRGWHNGQTPLSPLAGPVLTGDDDDLFFPMDH